MTDDDPVPLKAGGEASPELVRALYALGKPGAADAARLERVAKQLEAALGELPPPGAATNGAKLLGTKTLITGIVIGVAALSWLGYQLSRRPAGNESRPDRASESSQLVAPEVAAPPLASKDEPVELPRVAPESLPPADRPAPPTAPSSSRRGVGRHGGPTRGGSVGPSSGSSQGSANSAEASATPAAPAPAAVAEEAVAPAPKPAEQKLTARAAPEEPPAVPQRSEVGLLFEERKAMAQEPLAALGLLEEHAQRFPGGMLGPEREVLRIEALRKLGRTAEAAERMRAFEARYPKSIHLRRLQERTESSAAP